MALRQKCTSLQRQWARPVRTWRLHEALEKPERKQGRKVEEQVEGQERGRRLQEIMPA